MTWTSQKLNSNIQKQLKKGTVFSIEPEQNSDINPQLLSHYPAERLFKEPILLQSHFKNVVQVSKL